MEETAETQGVSVNVLVNQLLRRHALFIRWADSIGAQSVSPQALMRLLDELPEDRVAQAGATSGAAEFRNVLNMMGRPLTFESFQDLVVDYFGGSDACRWYTCFHHDQGDHHVFHLQHSLGRKWSVYLGQFLLAGLTALTHLQGEAAIYEFAVNVKVALPKPKRG